MYFNEVNMHTKPIKIVEIYRVVFQEGGHVHNRQVAQAEQHGPMLLLFKKVERNNNFKRLSLF